MTDAVEKREAEVQEVLAYMRALPTNRRPSLAALDGFARLQADWVSSARGLEQANAEIDRLRDKYPDERPQRG